MSGELELEAGWARLKAARLRLEADVSEFKAEQRIWEATKGRGGGGGGSSERDLEAAKAKLEAERLELETEKTRLRVAQAQLGAAQSQLEAAKSQLVLAHAQLNDARADLETARRHLEAAKAQTDINNARLEAAKASLEASNLKFEAATKQLNAAKSKFDEATAQLETATSGITSGTSARLEEESSRLRLQIGELQSEISKLQTTTSQLENDKFNLEAELRKTKADLSDKVRELERQLDQVKRENERLRYENSKLEEEARKANPPVVNPKVFFDLTIGGAPAGRIVMELYADTTPYTADHFRALCTGEKGVRRNGRRLHYKGSQLEGMHVGNYFWGGSIIFGDAKTHTPSMFAENYTRKNTGSGDLIMAVDSGQLIHGSMFYITTSMNSQFHWENVVIGKVIEGMGVVDEIGRLRTGPYNFTTPVVIADCGQLQIVTQVCQT